jgi:hypothetical protein
MHSAWKSLNPQSQDKRAHRGNRSSSERGNLAKRRSRERDRQPDGETERERERERKRDFFGTELYSRCALTMRIPTQKFDVRAFFLLPVPRVSPYSWIISKNISDIPDDNLFSPYVSSSWWSRKCARLMRTYAPLRVTSHGISILKFRAISWQYHALVIRSNNCREC